MRSSGNFSLLRLILIWTVPDILMMPPHRQSLQNSILFSVSAFCYQNVIGRPRIA
jgi:hypothetical protein